MRYLLHLILLSICTMNAGGCGSEGRDISPQVTAIVSRIEQIDAVYGEAVGFGMQETHPYVNFTDLAATATNKELRFLTEHLNAAVRCYAFWALACDHSVNLFPIIVNHLDDTETVCTGFYSIQDEVRVGDFFIDVVTQRYIDLEVQKLDSAQIWALDSILIFGPYELYARKRAIERAEPREDFYQRFRELVLKENNLDAVLALARYQKERDVELILASGSYRAFNAFPHPRFFPVLRAEQKKILDSTHFSYEWRALYKAIASYENTEAVELLKVPFTEVKHANMRRYHINFVFDAVREHKVPIFHDLLWILWIEEKRITPDVFEYFLDTRSDDLYESAIAALLNVYELNLSDANYLEIGATENVLTSMLNLVLARDSAEAIDLVAHNLKIAYVHEFRIFADAATRIKNPAFVEPLFARLETAWNAHIYLKAAEALIAFNDDAVNNRILDARKLNNHLSEGWGADSLDLLMMEYGIE